MPKPHKFFCRDGRCEMIVLFDQKNSKKPFQEEFTLFCNPPYKRNERSDSGNEVVRESGNNHMIHSFNLDVKNNQLYCHNCQLKLVEVENQFTLFGKPITLMLSLKDLKCPNPNCSLKFSIKENDYIPGNDYSKSGDNLVDSDDNSNSIDYSNGWSESDKKRIQEEEGLSDEDMANGAWIDF